MRLGTPPQSQRRHSRRAKFCAHVCARFRGHNHDGPVRLSPPIQKAILFALSERDETAAICRDKGGNPKPDPELRHAENVPPSESIDAFFEREVKPHVPDAWIDTSKCDEKDGKVGIVGYEINFNRYFYRYAPPRPLEEIEADIRTIEKDIMWMLAEVTGGNGGAHSKRRQLPVSADSYHGILRPPPGRNVGTCE